MIERLLITGLIGLFSVAGFEIFSGMRRKQATAASQVTRYTSGPHILYFRSESCTGCATQTELMTRLDDDLQSVIQKVDVDVDPQLAQAYGVLSLPTTLIMDAGGNARYINYGVVNPKKLTSQWQNITGK